MKVKILLTVLLFSFSTISVNAQTPEQQKEIDKALRMRDSIMNTPEYKAAMKQIDKINVQAEKFEKKLQQDKITKKKQSKKNTEVIKENNFTSPKPSGLLSSNVSYSATSYLQSKNSGNNFGSYKSVLKIYQAPNMMRFEDPEKISVPIIIFQYDKDIIWSVHHEQPQYKGVKLYQEFELQNGRGMSSHIDNIVSVMLDLKNSKKLKNMGKEMIDGHLCTRYRKERIISWEPAPNNVVVYNYWINKDKILIKMSYTGPGTSGMLETKNINLSSQPENLFAPPSDYKKAGNIIKWKEEKQKVDAQKNNN